MNALFAVRKWLFIANANTKAILYKGLRGDFANSQRFSRKYIKNVNHNNYNEPGKDEI